MCITSRTVKHNSSLNWVTFSISGIPHLKETGTSMCIDSPLEMEMATHSSILGWSIPWTEEPGGLQAVGSQRGRHNWATKQQHRQSTRAVVTEFHRPMAHIIHIYPLTVLKAGRQDCAAKSWFLVRPLFLACRRLSPCVFMRPFTVCMYTPGILS